ncbi:hypothetical protein ACMGDK_09545 [Chryseobacterium sp. DT-3]|uniref:hypothetical protein n=1 Tax=Chryseobacterium sp. DT-3 TaxID=3396164 RepID=UPI003F194E36
MKRKVLSLLSLSIGFFGFSQTSEIYFKYDEAGNQRYRGPDINAKQAPENSQEQDKKMVSMGQSKVLTNLEFWKEIRFYPVPVNDYLRIDWTDKVDGLIESVSLYQHSTVHWKFQQQNIPSLNKQLKINMTGYDWGVYVVRFVLKDGRILSKNITKR